MQGRESDYIYYFKNIKYLLAKDAWFVTGIKNHSGGTSFIRIYPDGSLHIRKGWGWDGASGPTIDTDSALYASLAHDALAVLIRQGILPFSVYEKADKELIRLAGKKHMWKLRLKTWAWIMTNLVKGRYARPDQRRRMYRA